MKNHPKSELLLIDTVRAAVIKSGGKGGGGLEKRCVVIAGAPDLGSFEAEAGDFVIAADRGYLHAKSLGIRPDLLIGDFDSLEEGFPDDLEIIRAPVIKDDTDTVLAVKKGLELGYKNFLLLGCLGGRLDHQFANLATCAFIAEAGAFCKLKGEKDCLYAFKNSRINLKKIPNSFVSVFAFSGPASGVSLKGLFYELEDATLIDSFPLGVSNEFVDEEASIEVKDGILFVIVSEV